MSTVVEVEKKEAMNKITPPITLKIFVAGLPIPER